MASFVGTTSLAIDAMRATLTALRARTMPAVPRSSSTASQRTWHPSQGIIFENSIKVANPVAKRDLSTAPDGALRRHMSMQSDAEDNYVLANSFNLPDPDSTLDTGTTESTRTTTFQVDNVTYEREDNVPHTTFEYKMSEEVLRNARMAQPGEPDSYWSHSLYSTPDNRGVVVHYCKSKNTTERVAQRFLNEKVLGFDIEWVAESNRNQGIKRNVSLIQIASPERVALFHIAAFSKDTVDDLVAPTLKKIMENPAITKVGVAIKADVTRLRKYLSIESQGIFELSHLYKLVKFSASKEYKNVNKRLVSLASQVQEHLQLPMYKGELVRSSDWSEPLTKGQIMYAASDSYAGLVLYDVLELKRQNIQPTPPRPHNAELNLPIRLADGVQITVEDTLEDVGLEPEPDAGSYIKASTLPEDYIENMAKDISFELENEEPDLSGHVSNVHGSSRTNALRSATRAPPPSSSSATESKPQLVVDAENWASEYKLAHSNCRSIPAHLRSYALWQNNPDLGARDVAKLLRSPPLLESTVQNYILSAIANERLPFDVDRMKGWPKDILGARRYAGVFAGRGELKF